MRQLQSWRKGKSCTVPIKNGRLIWIVIVRLLLGSTVIRKWVEKRRLSRGYDVTVCSKFKVILPKRRNFSEKWLWGAESVRTSNIRDHTKADEHAHAMKREHARKSFRRSHFLCINNEGAKQDLWCRKRSTTTHVRHRLLDSHWKKFHFKSTLNSASWRCATELPLEARTQMKLPAKASHIS